MKQISYTRIDDRLIHGQVMTQWIQHSGANEVLIVDDAVAKDTFLQMIMKSSVPATIGLKVMSVADATDYLLSDGSEKVFVLVKVPSVLVALADAGVSFPEINVGGIGAKAGRTTLYKNISASDEEREDLRKLCDKGIRCYFRPVQSDSEEDVSKHV